MSIDDLVKHVGRWLRGEGPMADIVISSRIRLARNLAAFPFLSKASEAQREDIERLVRQAIDRTALASDVFYVDIGRMDELDRQVLVERHLISRQHADAQGCRGAAISNQETVTLMTNEEDHLRTQVLGSGLRFDELWQEISRIDDALGEYLEFAFHPQFGYLTACPTNAGTGIRVSVMLHLPALKLVGEIEKVFRAARDMHLAVRGLYGEGTEASGDFYQVSNQITLGKTEEELIDDFRNVVIPKIVEYESQARQALLQERCMALDDRIWRAYGTLVSARTISSEESLSHLSHLRMGVNLGRLDQVDLNTLNELFLLTQPAHLQKMRGTRLNGEQRSIARADFIRQRLGNN